MRRLLGMMVLRVSWQSLVLPRGALSISFAFLLRRRELQYDEEDTCVPDFQKKPLAVGSR